MIVETAERASHDRNTKVQRCRLEWVGMKTQHCIRSSAKPITVNQQQRSIISFGDSDWFGDQYNEAHC